jgi:hypothetical protein
MPFQINIVDPEEWLINLEHLERNTVKCYQLCGISEVIATGIMKRKKKTKVTNHLSLCY